MRHTRINKMKKKQEKTGVSIFLRILFIYIHFVFLSVRLADSVEIFFAVVD